MFLAWTPVVTRLLRAPPLPVGAVQAQPAGTVATYGPPVALAGRTARLPPVGGRRGAFTGPLSPFVLQRGAAAPAARPPFPLPVAARATPRCVADPHEPDHLPACGVCGGPTRLVDATADADRPVFVCTARDCAAFQAGVGYPLCYCGSVAARFVAGPTSARPGVAFFKCGAPRGIPCGFWRWADKLPSLGVAQLAAREVTALRRPRTRQSATPASPSGRLLLTLMDERTFTASVRGVDARLLDTLTRLPGVALTPAAGGKSGLLSVPLHAVDGVEAAARAVGVTVDVIPAPCGRACGGGWRGRPPRRRRPTRRGGGRQPDGPPTPGRGAGARRRIARRRVHRLGARRSAAPPGRTGSAQGPNRRGGGVPLPPRVAAADCVPRAGAAWVARRGAGVV
eukprot:TRINITY_DN8133_c0_g1_i1.p1 TRINITY_DN8133_c0_g1~~TRINITY_DN8133_c0_g1_i1.p1  ORF type:complete len:397 (+),score=46.05 TRINITY_DN8133_c0_g1_i1:342-1532(+)